jgi:hypothetical protein
MRAHVGVRCHESRRFLILLTANEIARLWCSWDPVFDGTIRLGIVDRSHYLAENGASVLRGFELVKPQVGLLRNPNKYVRTPLARRTRLRPEDDRPCLPTSKHARKPDLTAEDRRKLAVSFSSKLDCRGIKISFRKEKSKLRARIDSNIKYLPRRVRCVLGIELRRTTRQNF